MSSKEFGVRLSDNPLPDEGSRSDGHGTELSLISVEERACDSAPTPCDRLTPGAAAYHFLMY